MYFLNFNIPKLTLFEKALIFSIYVLKITEWHLDNMFTLRNVHILYVK